MVYKALSLSSERNVRLYFLYRQYTNLLYFNLYLNTAYAAHYVYFKNSIDFFVSLNFPSASITHWSMPNHKLFLNN